MSIRSVYRLILIILLASLLVQVNAQEQEPAEYIYSQTKQGSLRAFVFQPAKKSENSKRPAIAIFHGGGWSIGEASWGFGRARHFADLGMVAISVQYRLSDEKNITPIEAMKDTRDFFRWLRQNSNNLGIEPGMIAGYGWSAGAHLIASAAVFGEKDEEKPDALVLVSPALDIGGDGWVKRLLLGQADPVDISPSEHVVSGMPPTLILIGEDDTVTPLSGSRRFHERMLELGNSCHLEIYPGVGHLFTPSTEPDNGWPNPDKEVQQKAFTKADLFLRDLKYVK